MNKSALLTLLCATALAACSTTAQKSAATDQQSAVAQAPTTPIVADKMSAAEMEARKLATQRAELAKKSVFFAFDQFSVDAKYRDVVKEQADFIAAHPNDAVMVEGNADERGSREYNLGLGERRGNAASSAVQASGGSAGQLTVVSYGEERPVCTESNEECWARNRRAELVYTAK